MDEIFQAFGTAFDLMASFDPTLVEIVVLSLEVSLAAVAIAGLIGLPMGAALAVYRFPGRRVLIVTTNALMGLPPVVIGLVVYLLLSNAGPLGFLDLLFTAGAMIIAQTILVTPIVTALSRQVVEDLWGEYSEQLRSLGCTPGRAIRTLLWDGRSALATALLAGLGRALGEVGAVIIVGGNIAHHTRVMTTAIALETSRGDLALALALGIILIFVALALNAGAAAMRGVGTGRAALPAP